MLARLLGANSMAAQLKGGLDESARAARGIAHRVANAANGPGAFSSALDEAGVGEAAPVDLEKEMASLAEEQLRFDATTQLLQKTYQQMRLGIREG